MTYNPFFRKSAGKASQTLLLAAAIATFGSSATFAAGDRTQAEQSPTVTSVKAPSTMTAGEVRKVDAGQAKVTIKHEPIANLEMPAMTMVFRTKSADMLKDLKVGDKILFNAQSSNGDIVVTQIRRAG